MRRLPVGPLASILVGAIWASSIADVLDEATRQQPGRARRFSTGRFDPESNKDAWSLGPGETKTFGELEGPGEIRHVWFTISGELRWTRTIVVRIYWDGSDVPSVETPIGDFFGAGNGMRANVSTVPIEVTSYGRALNSYWHMPFRRGARVALTNEGRQMAWVYCQIDWLQLPALDDSTLYFHARYKQDSPRMPFEPYVIFEGEGEGQYVGTVFSSQAALAHWAGEADDRYWIDGEEEPSLVGTGTEDWFTDAWNTRVFTNANAGVTIKEPNAVDCRFTAYRWHLQAPVTFRKSLLVEYERRSYIFVTDPETGRETEYDFKYRPDFLSSVAFWYQRGIARPFCELPPVERRLNPEVLVSARGAIDRLRCSDAMGNGGRPELVFHRQWFMGLQNGRVGSWLDVPFAVEEEGQYSLSVFQILFRDCGVWHVSLIGPERETVLHPALDFHDSWLARTENSPENLEFGTRREQKLGVVRLQPGEHRIRFRCVGANPLSTTGDLGSPGYRLGLDLVSIRKLPWDRMDLWMQEYLAREKELFGAMSAEARRTIDDLSASVEAYRRDRGAYPARLEDLIATKAPGGNPYLDAARIPLDPWRQPYQYLCPGRYRPDRYDLYSWRGDRSEPANWIADWTPESFRIEGAIEGEDLRSVGGSAWAVAAPQEVMSASIPPTSGGKVLFMDLGTKGGTLTLALPDSVRPGRYRVTLHLLRSWDYADTRWSIDGSTIASSVPGYSTEIVRTAVDGGEVTLGAGPHTVAVEALRPEPTTGRSCAGLDAIVLEPIE